MKCPLHRGFIMRLWASFYLFFRKVSVVERCPLTSGFTIIRWIILKMIYLSKIHEKDQCLYPIHQQMICSIYDFVFQYSIFYWILSQDLKTRNFDEYSVWLKNHQCHFYSDYREWSFANHFFPYFCCHLHL